jgi:hypothetical protein
MASTKRVHHLTSRSAIKDFMSAVSLEQAAGGEVGQADRAI